MKHLVVLLVLSSLGCSGAPDIKNYCYANGLVMTCNFTNLGGKGALCVTGGVKRKDSTEIAATPIPLCSGPLEQYQSAEVSVGWGSPSPMDVCKDGNGMMDWGLCDFVILPEGTPVNGAPVSLF